MSGLLRMSTLITGASRFIEALVVRRLSDARAIVHGDFPVPPPRRRLRALMQARLLAEGGRMSYAASSARSKGEPL